jgi:hypothetical protein
MPLCPQIVITPITVTSTGMTQTSIIPIVAASTEEIDELQVEIDTIEVSVNGKNHIYRQATAPDGSVFPLTEGDVWFDTDDGNKQYYWTGTAWISVQDTGIAAAETAAAAAAAAATAAQTTADGKNKIYRQATAPTGTFVVGDLWFNTSEDNKPNRWNGSAWEAYGFGNLAIGNLDAGKITTGFLAAGRIQTASLDATVLVAGSITAAQIAAGTITASQIAASTITATQIAAGTITASQIQARSISGDRLEFLAITANEIDVETITAAEIAAGSITVDRLSVGTLTGFTIQTSGSTRIRMQDSTNSINFIVSGSQRAHLVPAGTNGVIMHYGSSPNSAATSYPLVFVSSGSVVVAQSSTKFLEVSSLGVVANGDLYSPANFYNQDTTTTTNAANTWMSATTGLTRRSTASSQRYKENIVDIRTVADLDPQKLLNLPVRAFTYKADYLDSADDRSGSLLPGFIAEEVANVYAIAADQVEGIVESWNDRYVVPAMLALIQDLHARIKILEGTNE